jgi:hypothetical protein
MRCGIQIRVAARNRLNYIKMLVKYVRARRYSDVGARRYHNTMTSHITYSLFLVYLLTLFFCLSDKLLQ